MSHEEHGIPISKHVGLWVELDPDDGIYMVRWNLMDVRDTWFPAAKYIKVKITSTAGVEYVDVSSPMGGAGSGDPEDKLLAMPEFAVTY
ncbi:MAG: hypothetical protein LBN02_09975 [Oscillospiraceae bacterium]|jgi:hypothetical protein|nr:hypothetical protein [Oscillospiraceae bacterium]